MLLYTISVLARMDAELDESSVDDVVQCEERIVIQSRALLPNGSQHKIRSGVDDLDEILRPLGLQTRLLVVERANSLALCFICMTLSAVMRMRDQWCNQQLKYTVESLFTFLSGSTRTVHIKRLTWPMRDYQRCLEYFDSAQSNHRV